MSTSTTPTACISDHPPVTANNITTRCPKPTVTYSWRKLGNVDATQFETALRQSELFSSPASTTDGFAKQLERSPSRSRWLSTEAVPTKRERRRLKRRWQSTRDEHDRMNYRRACRTANELINASRREYFRKRLLECNNQPHDKRWRV